MLFSYIVSNAASKGTPAIVVAHRRELIAQISLSLCKFGVLHNVIAPADAVRDITCAHHEAFGRSFVHPSAPVMVGSVQTVSRRLSALHHSKPLVIIDESHHLTPGTQWAAVMDHCYSRGGRGLMVTATPQRLDGKGLGVEAGGYADTLIEGPPMSWLIEQGYLSPYRVFTTSKPLDMSGIRTRMGDYAKDEIADKMDRPSIVGDAVQHYRQSAYGKKAIVYCCSIAHSLHTAQAFCDAGIPAAHIDGETPAADRARIVRGFADGKYMVLCNQSIFTEGFDLASVAQKDVTVDCVIDLAPTQSLSLYMQKVGRALRPADGKTAVILDHAGNVIRHDLPDAEREWSLDGRKRKRAANDNEPDVKIRTCPKCFAITPPVNICPVCGHAYEIKTRRIEEVDGQLVEISAEDREHIKRQQQKKQASAKTVAELMSICGYSRGRAEAIIRGREDRRRLMLDAVEQGRVALRDAYRMTSQELRNLLQVTAA